MKFKRFMALAAFATAYLFIVAMTARAQTSILNVSYDVSRELYKDLNPMFIAQWKAANDEALTINQSHGGSSKQALSVISGLEADVVTMNQAPDIDILVERGGLVAKDWRDRFPYNAAPYTTTMVFLVRKGNPKAIRDWDDLIRPGIQVIVPNPKVTGNGRYTYLAAYGYALGAKGGEAGARDFVAKLFANVPVLDGGGRGASTTFTQRDTGDVLVTFENEAVALGKELGAGKFEVIYPSISIEAPAPLAIVETVVKKRGSGKVATAYLDFLFTRAAQEIMAKYHLRPSMPDILAAHADQFPQVKTFTVENLLGGWAKVQKEHFADGAIYDQIAMRR